MIVRLKPRQSRILALGLAFSVALLAFWLLFLPLIWIGSERSEQLALLRRQAEMMEGLASSAPQYAAVMKRLAANPQIQSYVFATPQSSLALAQLQGQVNQLITAAGGSVNTSQALPETSERALTKISVSATFEGDIKALVATLHSIEAARPLLFIAKLSVRDLDGEWGTQVTNAVPNKLQVDLIVIAYMRKT